MASRKAIPTLNRCGWQMATPSPLVEEWISSYDNINSLMDVGCAFGINTFEALQQGIPTIALDMEEGHLDFIRKKLTFDNKSLATCIFGCLPNNIPVPNNSISGILASEVLHFLIGSDVEEALSTLNKKLTEGGKLFLTVMSDRTLKYIASDERQSLFQHDVSKGQKGPGLLKVDELNKLSRYFKAKDKEEDARNHMAENVQLFSQIQMVELLGRTGYDVKFSTYNRHPGYPDGINMLEGLNLQVVAEKKS